MKQISSPNKQNTPIMHQLFSYNLNTLITQNKKYMESCRFQGWGRPGLIFTQNGLKTYTKEIMQLTNIFSQNYTSS